MTFDKKCRNCGRYPFCEEISSPEGTCDKWTELIGKCGECLGCNRLEDKKFKGTWRCE